MTFARIFCLIFAVTGASGFAQNAPPPPPKKKTTAPAPPPSPAPKKDKPKETSL